MDALCLRDHAQEILEAIGRFSILKAQKQLAKSLGRAPEGLLFRRG
jgi:hypothetical protein